jgi:hypothetical protein
MKLCFASFSLPKDGNSPEEYEDAFCPSFEQKELDENKHRFAVADGSSEGLLSGEWAKHLVKHYCENDVHGENLEDFLKPAYKSWDNWKTEVYFPARTDANKPILWFEEPGLEEGAFSTLLGICFKEGELSQSGTWEAISVGDSCVFQIRNHELVAAFPIKKSNEFDNRPFLIGSKPSRNRDIVSAFRVINGTFQSDDRFFLMTDALACWFLEQHEGNEADWRFIYDLQTDEGCGCFGDYVQDLRNKKKIKNDDVTLIRIDVF